MTDRLFQTVSRAALRTALVACLCLALGGCVVLGAGAVFVGMDMANSAGQGEKGPVTKTRTPESGR